MPFCPSGHESPGYAQFCTTCGIPLASDQAASTPLSASPGSAEAPAWPASAPATPPPAAAWYASPSDPAPAAAPAPAAQPSPSYSSPAAPHATPYAAAAPAAAPAPAATSWGAPAASAYQPAAAAPSGVGPMAPAAAVSQYLPATQQQYGPPAGAVAPPFRFQIRRLSVIDQITAVASLLLFVALWMPWFGIGDSTYRVTIGGINAHSWLSFALVTCLVLIAYLTARAGWDRMPVKLPIAHAPLLLVVGLAQLLIVVLAVIVTPEGLDHAAGSWVGLIAALGASVPILIPVIRSSTTR